MKIIIIGNGVSGVTVAKFLRTQSDDTEITIITEEQDHYYPRPILIEFLAGRVKREEIYFYSPKWYEERKIQVELGKKVVKLDAQNKKLELEDGTEQKYDRLVLANGARGYIPSLPGFEKKGVFLMRTIADTQAIKDYATTMDVYSLVDAKSADEYSAKKKAVVLGGGFLGLETAYALLGAGLEPTVVEHNPDILSRQIDSAGAKILQNKLESMGIKFKLGVEAEEITGSGKVEGVKLKGGEVLPTDLVLMAAGVCPNTELARTANLHLNKGVLVNKFMQTENENVYACGDITEFENVVNGIIPVCLAQAQVAAYNVLNGPKLIYKGTMPSNTLKIAGIDLACLGNSNPVPNTFENISKDDQEKGLYKKLILKSNKVIGATILGDRRDVLTWTKIINQNIDIGRFKDKILNNDFDLTQVFK
jgi:nitrite reductase (NADH) large subunit